ncbi:MAG: PEP-CTERM sorting domain-containing protein, partial [Candidatus Nealsonbacteria bacterium]|nr:PEP-CTERM sorting domain-containing protein [Candidatus Nealsonbacteria bacterium]
FKDGDFDLDGDVDFGDYMILEAAFGESVPVASAAVNIPEPGTLAMLLLAAVTLGWWRQRR